MDHGITTVYQGLALDNHKRLCGKCVSGQGKEKLGMFLDHRQMKRDTSKLLEHLKIHIQDIEIQWPRFLADSGRRWQ